MSALRSTRRISAVRIARRTVLAAFVSVPLFATSLAKAQDTFDTETLSVPTDEGVIELTVEIADTPARRARGYMGRTGIQPDEGMLFVYAQDRPISMWMRNTPTALDMIFLEADGTVESIAAYTTPFSEAIIDSDGEVRFVLEVLAGSSAKWGLEPGDRLTGPRFSP